MPNRSTTCKHEGCKRAADGGRGYCRRHYSLWKRGALPKGRYKTCRVEGCGKRMIARGRCAEHLARDYPGKSARQAAEAQSSG